MSHRTMQTQHALPNDQTPTQPATPQPSNNWRLGLDTRLQQQQASAPKHNAQQ